MCGIVGQVGSSPLELAPAIASLRHRGPDDEGSYRFDKGGVAADLGFRRLSIIDLSRAGHQPMSNEDGSIWLVCNGEIYNHRALRTELQARGHTFRSHSDSEAILHCYEEYGDGCLQRLRGMFALALWDEKKQRLLAARDRLGIKPLVYSEQGGRLLFGSEIKALLALGVSRELEPQALPQYLRYLYLLPPLTFFRHVRRLGPGEKLVWEKGRSRVERYWDLALPPQRRDLATIVPQLRALLEEVVRDHLESDVPLGVYLSGGLDSSTLVALASRATTRPLRTFCMTFGAGEGLYDEREHARAVAEHFGTVHTEIPVKPDLAALLPEMVAGFDEPFGNPTALLSWALARETRRHVTVALAGDGGDEVFLGYPRYQGATLARGYRFLPKALRAGLARSLAPLIRESARGRHWPRRAREFLATGALPLTEMYEAWSGYFSPREIETILSPSGSRLPASGLADPSFATGARGDTQRGPDSGAAQGDHPARVADLFARAPGGDFLDQVSYVDLKSFLPGNLLAYTDAMGMAHSLEVRVPFCDHRLVELMASVDAGERLTLFQTKRLLRLAMKDLLPEQILKRPKLGFNPPMGIWLSRDLRGLTDDLLEPGRLRREGFFDPAEVAALVREQRQGNRDLALHVWSLLVFQTWLTIYKPVPA